MDDRFHQEFYASQWQRVLPLGPDGIQPYVRLSRSSRLPAPRAKLGRLIATLGALAFARVAAVGMAKRPVPLQSAPRAPWQRGSLRLAHQAARPHARSPAPMGWRSGAV